VWRRPGRADRGEAAGADLSRIVTGDRGKLRDVSFVVAERIQQMHERIKDPTAIVGLDMGREWSLLNHTIHGVQEGTYFVLAAPSGVGKTAIAGSWARRFAVDLNEPTLYLTWETGEEVMTQRLLAEMSGVEIDRIVTGYMTPEEVERVHEAGRQLSASPLVISGMGRVYEEAIHVVRHDILRRGTRVVFFDYIQLMGLADAGRMNRYLEIGQISGGLIGLAQETGIAIIALAQINREGSKKGRSSKLDLGDSYRPAQDADHFYVVDEKSAEEIEEDGLEMGNRYGFLDKNRRGRDKVGCDIIADMSTMRIKEAPRVSNAKLGREDE
jgi:replicative DNA helicase